MSIFDLSKPGARAIPSSFGGGWIVPLTPAGTQALMKFFDDEPAPLDPIGGDAGWIVEPQQTSDLAVHLREAGVAWEIGS